MVVLANPACQAGSPLLIGLVIERLRLCVVHLPTCFCLHALVQLFLDANCTPHLGGSSLQS